jgi:hypothetical protein
MEGSWRGVIRFPLRYFSGGTEQAAIVPRQDIWRPLRTRNVPTVSQNAYHLNTWTILLGRDMAQDIWS